MGKWQYPSAVVQKIEEHQGNFKTTKNKGLICAILSACLVSVQLYRLAVKGQSCTVSSNQVHENKSEQAQAKLLGKGIEVVLAGVNHPFTLPSVFFK